MRHKYFSAIREVARLIGEPTSTIKHWEKEFPQIKPKLSAGGTRQYTQKDIDQLRLVKQLIREEGMTISGVKKRLEGQQGKDSLEAKADLHGRLTRCLEQLKELRDALPKE